MKPDQASAAKDRPEDDEANSPGQSADKPAAGVDARDDPEKLKKNRDRLGVDEAHETPEMKEHHRGTFP